MIISWFTDPSKGTFVEGSGKFSSYYQYDTETKQFTRVRMELGRKASSSGYDQGDTMASYKETRYVSFSDEKIRDGKNWTVENGELKYKGNSLEQTPSSGDYVYDLTNPKSVPHFGNPVTDSPNLPEGIEVRHLSLIANDTMVNKTSFKFTTSKATGDALSEALKTKVSDIMKTPFDKITDQQILDKLKSQVSDIKNAAIEPSKSRVIESLDAVSASMTEINEKIMNGEIVPNGDFEKAYSTVQTKVVKAKMAAGKSDVKEALSELAEAQKNIQTAIDSVVSETQATLKQTLQNSSSALDDATKASNTWDKIQNEYDSLESADSVDAYEKEIGVEETPVDSVL